VVPSFRCTSLPGMPPSPTPGSPTSLCSRASMPTWPSPFDHRLGTPDPPAIRSTRAAHFVASLVRFRYGLPSCSPPCADRTGTPQPSGAFTTRLSTDWSPSPLLVITTTVTGLLLLAGLAPAGMAASFAARSKRAVKQCPQRRQLSPKAAMAAPFPISRRTLPEQGEAGRTTPRWRPVSMRFRVTSGAATGHGAGRPLSSGAVLSYIAHEPRQQGKMARRFEPGECP
jgi:hypothetical protein